MFDQTKLLRVARWDSNMSLINGVSLKIHLLTKTVSKNQAKKLSVCHKL